MPPIKISRLIKRGERKKKGGKEVHAMAMAMVMLN